MLFRDHLYTVVSEEHTPQEHSYALRLCAEHPIYRAHFPSDPITPGVCILQAGLELLSDALGAALEIDTVRNVKFLSVLRPDGKALRARVHRVTEEDGRVTAQVDFDNPEAPVAKLSLICCRKTAK